ncbi:O-fucosyltransferase family protein [Paenibacillus sp. chi10]|uniref:O-fucosyltransferase family protein n=1 Tax=Paenibacillus suaedae TaxID=3077233 RepID=A0AAJ2JSB9_9BACL|nr:MULTISPECIES: O-fucosyltransferase family protein [unclassified Paenibacillus]MDT8976143.1 O-fucosyltransferase family protein [Paenibacillus sp. chi10]GAV11188.1 hypothetical protein PBN151_1115 [Paenibacillus sp. NAIST15-1]
MIYFQNSAEGSEGLCNQLMSVFRAVGEALYHANEGSPTGILLQNVQTRTSIDFDVTPYFRSIAIDCFVDVHVLRKLLSSRQIDVKRAEEVQAEVRNQAVICKRYPIRQMSEIENKNSGLFIANAFPFAKHIVELSNFIIASMSEKHQWIAAHLRIEKDLLLISDIKSMGLEHYAESQLHCIYACMEAKQKVSAIYLASGLLDEEYAAIAKGIQEKNGDIMIYNKKIVLEGSPNLKQKFDSLCLEEQALVDWLVCIHAPYFIGPHSSSFSYLAGYMRHYRGYQPDTLDLFPTYQPYWDMWFPCI